MDQSVDYQLRDMLLRVEKPGRYTGGEYGSLRREEPFKVAVSYPDLYEIGMSNNAVRILYGLLNRIEGVQCERVFAPAVDMERELRDRGLPLFSLESRLPLRAFDVIAFSVGYELNATAVLQILDSGGVALRAEERTDADPLVMGGGPGLINPVPFLRFFDGVFIGEAEEWLPEAFARLVKLKKQGAGRGDLLAFLEAAPAVATRRAPRAVRALYAGFGAEPEEVSFPVASLKAAQDHGAVEIMRGCPNGCRFCNAGFFYRPFRFKAPDLILRQAGRLVFDFGYREISLSSLSTGDYPGIGEVVRRLNADFAHLGTSFSLPSLKIDTVALELFREINTVRKSGLTFAVETPCPETQRKVNKPVSLEKTVDLLLAAKDLGWRQAKFYFMLGLPGFVDKDETDLIMECLLGIQHRTRMALHVNVGTFVPKPHTPFQWCAQLSSDAAHRRIGSLRARLPRHSFKVSFHLPYQSFLEGMIARGDQRAGILIEEAYRAGARFCAWEEHVDVELWKKVVAAAGWDVEKETYRAHGFEERLPWDGIDMGVARTALRREAERAERGELTAPCAPECSSPCGVCGRDITAGVFPVQQVQVPGQTETALRDRLEESLAVISRHETHTILFAFSKTGRAAFLSHLNVMTVFERSLLRAGYFCRMTEGFNPKPIMEFANPLPLGFESRCEVASVELYHFDDAAEFIFRMNAKLPEGLQVFRVRELPAWQPGEKKRSLMALCRGGDYKVLVNENVNMNDISDDPELVFSHYSESSRTLIVRYAGTASQAHSIKKYLSKILGSDKFIELCRPSRIMTLAMDPVRKTYGNLFDMV